MMVRMRRGMLKRDDLKENQEGQHSSILVLSN